MKLMPNFVGTMARPRLVHRFCLFKQQQVIDWELNDKKHPSLGLSSVSPGLFTCCKVSQQHGVPGTQTGTDTRPSSDPGSHGQGSDCRE